VHSFKFQSSAFQSTKKYHNKIKKELKYEGSDIKLFRKKVKDEMWKRRLEVERI